MTRTIRKTLTILVAAPLFIVGSLALAGDHAEKGGKDIVDTAVSAGQFETLAAGDRPVA